MSKVSGEAETMKVIIVNYGANVDFFGNFISNETLDFGGFIGLGLGANTLTGKQINDYKTTAKANGTKFTDTGFDIWLNVGLRTNIATNHGLEVAVRVPFLPVTMATIKETSFTDKLTFGQTYSVLARYTFSF